MLLITHFYLKFFISHRGQPSSYKYSLQDNSLQLITKRTPRTVACLFPKLRKLCQMRSQNYDEKYNDSDVEKVQPRLTNGNKIASTSNNTLRIEKSNLGRSNLHF